MKIKKIIWLALIPFLLSLNSCSDDITDGGRSELPPPDFPSFEAADLNDEFFMISNSASEADSSNESFSEAFRYMQQTILVLNSSGSQKIFFELAKEIEADFTDDSFVWRVNADNTSGLSGTGFEFEVTAEIVNDSFDGSAEWSVTSDLSGLIPDDLFPEDMIEEKIELIRGFTTENGLRGEWNVFGPVISNLTLSGTNSFSFFGIPLGDLFQERINRLEELLGDSEVVNTLPHIASEPTFIWEKLSDTERVLTLRAINVSDESEVLWEFRQNGVEFEFELQNVGEENSLLIFWNAENREGFIEKDGERSCWDNSFANVEC